MPGGASVYMPKTAFLRKVYVRYLVTAWVSSFGSFFLAILAIVYLPLNDLAKNVLGTAAFFGSPLVGFAASLCVIKYYANCCNKLDWSFCENCKYKIIQHQSVKQCPECGSCMIHQDFKSGFAELNEHIFRSWGFSWLRKRLSLP